MLGSWWQGERATNISKNLRVLGTERQEMGSNPMQCVNLPEEYSEWKVRNTFDTALEFSVGWLYSWEECDSDDWQVAWSTLVQTSIATFAAEVHFVS